MLSAITLNAIMLSVEAPSFAGEGWGLDLNPQT